MPSHAEPQTLFIPCWQLCTPSGNAKNGKNRHSLGGVVLGVFLLFRNGGNENSTCISKQNQKIPIMKKYKVRNSRNYHSNITGVTVGEGGFARGGV